MPSRYWPSIKIVFDRLFAFQEENWKVWEEKEAKMPFDERSPALITKNTIAKWRWSEITKTKLNNIFNVEQKIEFSKERLILFLPPFPKEDRAFVPVLSLKYAPDIDCLNMRVAMYRLDEKGIPCGFGFRMESPTPGNRDEGRGIHDFFHVQIIKNLENHAPALGLPDWLPERQPAICIRASNPVDAVLNLILSLYGMDYLVDFVAPIKSKLRTNLMKPMC